VIGGLGRNREAPLAIVETRIAQKLGHAHDAVHRRADLVAHRGEEFTLRPARLLGQLLRLAELGGALEDAMLELGVTLGNLGEHPVEASRQLADFILASGVGAQLVVAAVRDCAHQLFEPHQRSADGAPQSIEEQKRGHERHRQASHRRSELDEETLAHFPEVGPQVQLPYPGAVEGDGFAELETGPRQQGSRSTRHRQLGGRCIARTGIGGEQSAVRCPERSLAHVARNVQRGEQLGRLASLNSSAAVLLRATSGDFCRTSSRSRSSSAAIRWRSTGTRREGTRCRS
jgi:hypothetical protein